LIKSAWKEKRAHEDAVMAEVERKLAILNERRQRIIDALLYGKIAQEVYDGQMQKVGIETETAAGQQADALIAEAEIDTVLDFAGWMLGVIQPVWSGANGENKRRLQAAIFPNGLSVNEEGFGTPEISISSNTYEKMPRQCNVMFWRPQGDSNPRSHRERVVS
jgi:hypothetical protein